VTAAAITRTRTLVGLSGRRSPRPWEADTTGNPVTMVPELGVSMSPRRPPWFEITDDLPRSERAGEELEAALKNPPTSGQSPG